MSGTSSKRDKPWLFRTYAGHSTAKASNELYRRNLAKGQTGLSVAFDLPTQTGYDPDHPLARGEVGKVGVPISHLGDMRSLFEGIPLAEMNTSMTINATAAWLLALYVALAEEQGADHAKLTGTVQNDILKEYLSRGTYIFPPAPSLRLIKDVIVYTNREMPKWNPTNVCSYHLQEAGATPGQELAFALATAEAVLDEVQKSGEVSPEQFPQVVGSISFFVNAGVRFITEVSKMRAFVDLWDEIAEQRYGVEDPKLRRFRYGVQVNSLGLTEQQPENNVYRILLSMLAVTLSKNARARAVQLPAWNEALGLPRPWDQQWSLRLQQIVAYETDLLDYGDIFDGSVEIDRKVEELKEQARAELAKLQAMGGAVAAIDYMKEALIASNAARVEAIEKGEQVLVGVNAYTETEASPLVGERHRGHPDRAGVGRDRAGRGAPGLAPQARREGGAAGAGRSQSGRGRRAQHHAAIDRRRQSRRHHRRMGPGPARGVRRISRADRHPRQAPDRQGAARGGAPRGRDRSSGKLGRTLTFVVGKPGLDGHSNGAEQIAVRATDVGMEVVYDGIRLTPAEIVEQASEASAHVVGLSILSGSHVSLVREVVQRLREAGLGDVPVVVGGIIPPRTSISSSNAGRRRSIRRRTSSSTTSWPASCRLVDAKAETLVEVSVPVPPLRAREKVPVSGA